MKHNQWIQNGKIYFWLYKGDYRSIPGYHCSWDNDGKLSVLELLDFLLELPMGSYRTINLTGPDEQKLNIPNCGNKILTKNKVTLVISESESKIISNVKYEIHITKERIIKLKEVLLEVQSGKELSFDFGEEFVNFWW
jgi:hypothetical protein